MSGLLHVQQQLVNFIFAHNSYVPSMGFTVNATLEKTLRAQG